MSALKEFSLELVDQLAKARLDAYRADRAMREHAGRWLEKDEEKDKELAELKGKLHSAGLAQAELQAKLVAGTGEQAVIDRDALSAQNRKLEKLLEQAGEDYANLMIQNQGDVKKAYTSGYAAGEAERPLILTDEAAAQEIFELRAEVKTANKDVAKLSEMLAEATRRVREHRDRLEGTNSPIALAMAKEILGVLYGAEGS